MKTLEGTIVTQNYVIPPLERTPKKSHHRNLKLFLFTNIPKEVIYRKMGLLKSFGNLNSKKRKLNFKFLNFQKMFKVLTYYVVTIQKVE